jgi:uncharacterized paraquat-inducible protein A
MKKFYCIHCSQSINAPDEMVGKRATCPTCRGHIQVPGVSKTQKLTQVKTPPPVPRAKATGIWRPPGHKYYVSCPQCRKITNYNDAKVPTDLTCRSCSGRFTVDQVSYPFSRFFWFLLSIGFLCAVSVLPFVRAKIISLEEIANLFGKSADSETLPMLIEWSLLALIFLFIILSPSVYLCLESSRRALRLNTISTIFGGSITIGWILIIPYLIIWIYIGVEKLQIESAAKDRRNKEMFNRSIEFRKSQLDELLNTGDDLQRKVQPRYFVPR